MATARAEISTPGASDGIGTTVCKLERRKKHVLADEILNTGKIQVI